MVKKRPSKAKLRRQRERKKTLRIVRNVLNEMIDTVDELVNPTDYFNIYKISTSEIDFLIELDGNNVDLLNGLHSEKAYSEGNYTVVYTRNYKVPDLNPWFVYNDGTNKYLISNIVLTDIRNNIPPGYTDTQISEFYIKNETNPINTILYITDPSLLKEREYTEEQRKHIQIREILDAKNEAFNNRMKVKPSVKNLQNIKK